MDGQPLLSSNSNDWYSFDAEITKEGQQERIKEKQAKKASVVRRLSYGAEERT